MTHLYDIMGWKRTDLCHCPCASSSFSSLYNLFFCSSCQLYPLSPYFLLLFFFTSSFSTLICPVLRNHKQILFLFFSCNRPKEFITQESRPDLHVVRTLVVNWCCINKISFFPTQVFSVVFNCIVEHICWLDWQKSFGIWTFIEPEGTLWRRWPTF